MKKIKIPTKSFLRDLWNYHVRRKYNSLTHQELRALQLSTLPYLRKVGEKKHATLVSRIVRENKARLRKEKRK